MASQQRPPRRPPASSARPDFNLGQVSFDPRRVTLPQMAIVGFVIGVLFHACVVFAVLDDSSSARSNGGATEPIIATNPQAAPTATRLLDRTDCNQIRGTDYRSETERQWFRANCS
jgi:hypothetical protein